MSKIVHKVPCIRADSAEKSHASTSIAHLDNAFISTLTGYENDLGDKMAQIDREAEIQAQELELSECLLLVSQLVELFKHTVIVSELQNQHDWHHDTRNDLRKQKGPTGNQQLDGKVEEIVVEKGISREQWNCLSYISYSNGDTSEITHIDKKYLRRIHDKAQRLLENEEREAVFALLKAIETHMSKDHYTHK